MLTLYVWLLNSKRECASWNQKIPKAMDNDFRLGSISWYISYFFFVSFLFSVCFLYFLLVPEQLWWPLKSLADESCAFHNFGSRSGKKNLSIWAQRQLADYAEFLNPNDKWNPLLSCRKHTQNRSWGTVDAIAGVIIIRTCALRTHIMKNLLKQTKYMNQN